MKAKAVVVALDSADLGRIERCVASGDMPVMGDLLARGALGRLTSDAQWLAGSVWPTLWSSTHACDHGFHHYLEWSPTTMSIVRPDMAMNGAVPFWRRLARAGAHVVAIDMPFVPPPGPGDGIEVCGWSTIESLSPPRANPSTLLAEIEGWHGRSPRQTEAYALQSVASLLRLRDDHLRIAGMLGDIGTRLIERERPDLLAIAFPGLHRCGHRLWDETGVAGATTPREQALIEATLDQVYAATDRALGQILETAGADEILICTPHGMGPNTSRVEILEEMLARVLAGSKSVQPPMALAARLRGAVPASARHWLKTRMPVPWQDRLTGFWRAGGRDWSTVEAISLVADLAGYIRLNIEGREAEGILTTLAAEEVSERIAEGLASFVDGDTGEPVVRETARIEKIMPDGPFRPRLPDLIVDWASSPAARHRVVVSPRHGEIAWPTPGRHPSGRSGNHRAEGFFLAVGPGLAPSAGVDGRLIDLAPTVLARLGADIPSSMRGRPLLARTTER